MRTRIGWWGLAVGMGLVGGGAAHGAAPSYHREVARILQEHCQDCHRPGQVAPFSLLTYEQARKRAGDLADVTERRKMPPWHASTKEGGPFRDARVLNEAEIATLAAWAEAGCPEGDPADAPPPRRWDSEWPLGTPDLVLKMPEPYALGAEGRDEHRVFVIPSGLAEGKWVAAVDLKPGNPKVVHHILTAFDIRKAAQKLDEADPGPGYKVFGGYGIIPSGNLGGWAPGKRPRPTPEGVGRYLPAGADVLMQVHYHKSGKPETDASAIGIYFAKGPIDKMARGAMVTPSREGFFRRPRLLIPAGDPRYEVTGTQTIEEDSHLISVTPHMHWLGKDFLLTATPPGGKPFTLIRVDDWDFNWQGGYDFEAPVALPKGTRIDMVAHFDNSAKNPANPNSPPKDVRWGEQTTDEMCIGFLQLTLDDEHRRNLPPPRLLAPRAE
jgi:mono/diheme cytochrome c family protein